MCGGPTRSQKTAAAGESQLQKDLTAGYEADAPKAAAVYQGLADKGLPYFGAETQYSTSDLAKQINQAKANLASREAGFGSALPSGFAEQEQRDLDLGGASAFDSNIMNLLQQQTAAREAGAGGLASLALPSAGTAVGAGQSVLQAPLQNNFWSNIIGGVLQGAGNIPFAFAH